MQTCFSVNTFDDYTYYGTMQPFFHFLNVEYLDCLFFSTRLLSEKAMKLIFAIGKFVAFEISADVYYIRIGETRNRVSAFIMFAHYADAQLCQTESEQIMREYISLKVGILTKNGIVGDNEIQQFSQSQAEISPHWPIIKSGCDKLANGLIKNLNFLFYGKPGTGKSEMIKIISAYTKLPLVIIPYSEIEQISTFSSKPCVYCVDEADKFIDETGNFSSECKHLDVLLQFMDGMLRPNGSILIICCNDVKRIMRNKVFARDGRLHIRLEFGYATIQQISHVINEYYSSDKHFDGGVSVMGDAVSTAALVSLFCKKKYTIAQVCTFIINKFINNVTLDKITEIDIEVYESRSNLYLFSPLIKMTCHHVVASLLCINIAVNIYFYYQTKCTLRESEKTNKIIMAKLAKVDLPDEILEVL